MRSPVARTIRVTPRWRMARIVCLASGRIRSSSTTAPAGWPSAATNTVSAPSSRARLRTVLTHAGSPVTPAQAARPTRTGRPRTVPAMPWPVTSSTASGRTSRQPRSADGAVGLARHLLYDPDLDAESGVLEAGASAGDE